MSNTMELNKAAQARSDEVSKAARDRCRDALTFGGVQAENAIRHAMLFDAAHTAMFTARLLRNGHVNSFHDGICAIHGDIARKELAFKESPDNSPMIVGGTFGGIG